MTRVIAILSGKGGVGIWQIFCLPAKKTTATVNISVALAQLGREVIAVDGNITTPNLGLHFGIPLYPVTLNDVINGSARLDEAIYSHSSGVKVIPASLSVHQLKYIDAEKLKKLINDLFSYRGIVIVDGAAGLGKEARTCMDIADEIIIITNPDLPSVTDALKTIKLAQKQDALVSGVIVNRVNGHRHELSIKEIREIVDYPIIGYIPEDQSIHGSIAVRQPLVAKFPRSRAAMQFKRIGANLIGEQLREEEPSFLETILNILRR